MTKSIRKVARIIFHIMGTKTQMKLIGVSMVQIDQERGLNQMRSLSFLQKKMLLRSNISSGSSDFWVISLLFLPFSAFLFSKQYKQHNGVFLPMRIPTI